MVDSIGYVLSALVAGVVLLIVQMTTMRGNEAAVSTLQYSAVKQSTVEFVGMMERDFQNLGSNFPYPDLLSDLAVLQYDTVSSTKRFDFLAQTKRGLPPDTVSYRWRQGNVIQAGAKHDKSFPSVIVERYVGGKLAGMNTGSITDFSLELKTAEGLPVMAAAETRQIEVNLKMIGALGSSGEIEESRWSATFHPMHIAKQDGIANHLND
jgi:hypothetical protein